MAADSSDAAATEGRVDGVIIFSKQTGHWCSSFADGDDGWEVSFPGDVLFALLLDDAKRGPSKLTPFSPLTCPA